jgi:hypothetical protein
MESPHPGGRLAAGVGLAALLAVCGVPATAAADVDSPCTYALSPPQWSGTPGGVGATLQLVHCEDPWQPVSSDVCITPPVGAAQCGKAYGFISAQAYLGNASAKGEFIATGRGCARRFGVNPVCFTVGPLRSTF